MQFPYLKRFQSLAQVALTRDAHLSQVLLKIGCILTISLFGLIAFVLIAKTIVGSIYKESDNTRLHYRYLFNEITEHEYFTHQARRTVQKIINTPDSILIPISAIDKLQNAPEGNIVSLEKFPWMPALALYKNSKQLSKKNSSIISKKQYRLYAIAIRIMLFDDAFWTDKSQNKSSYFISADGSLLLMRLPSLFRTTNYSASNIESFISKTLRQFEYSSPTLKDKAGPFWTQSYIHPLTALSTITSYAAIHSNKGELLGYIASDIYSNCVSSAKVNDRLVHAPPGGFSFFNEKGQYIDGCNDKIFRKISYSKSLFGKNNSSDLKILWRSNVAFIKKWSSISGWHVIYSIKLTHILAQHIWKCLIYVSLFFIASTFTVVGGMFIDRRILKPAAYQAQQLALREAFNRAIIEIAPIGLMVFRARDFSILVRNEVSRTMVNDAEKHDENARNQVYLDNKHHAALFIKQIIDSFKASPKEITELAVTNHGQTPIRRFSLRFATGHFHDGEVVLCALIDITHRYLIEKKLDDAKRTAEMANEAKSIFLATISHEVRTPLYSTLAALELLASRSASVSQRALIGMMQDSSRHLLQIIDDLLDFSKIEAGELTLNRKACNLLEDFERLVRGLYPHAHDLNLTLRAFISPDCACQIYGDALRIGQIVNNLLSNALKFTQHGFVDFYANFEPLFDFVKDDEYDVGLKLQIVDSGIGIAQENLARLFEPFSQFSSLDINTKVTGTGLGLSICQRLTKSMGGTIEVKSTLGLGSRFIVRIPLKLADKNLKEKFFSSFATKELNAYLSDSKLNIIPAILQGLTIQIFALHDEERNFWKGVIEQYAGKVVSEDFFNLKKNEITHFSQDKLNSKQKFVRLIIPGVKLETIEQDYPIDKPLTDQSVVYVLLDCLLGNEIICIQEHSPAIWKINAFSQALIVQSIAKLAQNILPTLNSFEPKANQLKLYGLKVLIAEDHPINNQLLSQQLIALGCVPLRAYDGNEALELCRLHHGFIDLILTDINMPNLDGYSLMKKLYEEKINLPAYGLTADLLSKDLPHVHLGMVGLLHKPISLKELSDVLNTIKPKNKLEIIKKAQTLQKTMDIPTKSDHQIILCNPNNKNMSLTKNVINREFLLVISNMTDEIRSLFIKTMDDDLQKLQQALNIIDWQQICLLSHRLRGIALTINWQALHKLIDKLNQAAHDENIKISRDSVSKIELIWHDVRKNIFIA